MNNETELPIKWVSTLAEAYKENPLFWHLEDARNIQKMAELIVRYNEMFADMDADFATLNERVEALSTPYKWTDKVPTEPGVYFLRRKSDFSDEWTVEVRMFEPLFFDMHERGKTSVDGYQFAGPVPEPE